MRTRIATVGLASFLGLAGLAWAVQEPVWQSYLGLQSRRALTLDEQAALARCEDPGWLGVSRVVEQDLPLDCSEPWFARILAGHLDDRERQWLRAVVDDPQRTVRQRMRAGTALIHVGLDPIPDWAFLVTDPGVGAAEDFLDALAANELPMGLADPLLRGMLDRRAYLEGDHTAQPAVLRWLRLATARPALASPDQRKVWSTTLLDWAGLSDATLADVLTRHAAGLTVQAVPVDLAPWVVNEGAACLDTTTPDCLAFAVALTERADRLDGGPSGSVEGGEALPATLPMPLWNLRYDEPAVVRAAAEALGEIAAWVAEAPAEDRPVRLLGSVAWPGNALGLDDLAAGRGGDPIDVIAGRATTPWSAALAALAIGERAGVAVEVYATAHGGVRLVVGDVSANVEPCGGMAAPDAPGSSWTTEAVVARASLEASADALRRGERGRALALVALAERMDPLGVAGAHAALREAERASEDAAMALGIAAGQGVSASVRVAPPAAGDGLADARWARFADPTACALPVD